MSRIAILMLGLCSLGTQAAPGLAGLPPTEPLRAALEAQPLTQAARQQGLAELAAASAMRHSPYEWTARAGTAQRSEAQGQRWAEQELGLERTLRWPGKASLDTALASSAEAVALAHWDRAWRDATLTLLQTWFDLVREERRAQGMDAQAALAAQQMEVVRLRVAAGDAPRLDWLQAQLEHERLAAEQASAALRARLARADWQRRYPALGTATVVLPATAPPVGEADSAVPAADATPPELAQARHEAALAQLRARRISLDRHADPTVGLRLARERSGEERVLGLSISWPFGGPQRDARVRGAAAEAAAAAARLQDTERQTAGVLQAERLQAQGLVHTHAQLARVAQQADETAALLRRAYAAGESPLNAVLQVQRQAREARTAAELALIDALQAGAQVQLRHPGLLPPPPLGAAAQP